MNDNNKQLMTSKKSLNNKYVLNSLLVPVIIRACLLIKLLLLDQARAAIGGDCVAAKMDRSLSPLAQTAYLMSAMRIMIISHCLPKMVSRRSSVFEILPSGHIPLKQRRIIINVP